MANPSRVAEYFEQHDTALIIRVPSAERAVGSWRARFDSSAPFGMPAHVTVLFPFVPRAELDDAVEAALREAVGGFRRFEVVFSRLEQRPDLVWLRPEPDDHLRELMAAVWDRFPQHPPYGGRFRDVVPHLSIADHDLDAFPGGFESAISNHLPIHQITSEVELVGFSGLRWESAAVFPLAPSDE